jgi:hypothetical protein
MTNDEVMSAGLKMLAQIKEAQANDQARQDGNKQLETAVENLADQAGVKQPEFITCPCCGKPTLVKPLELNGPVLDHYMACLVSGVPFSHTYPVYKGKLEITATRLTKKQEQTLRTVSNVLEMCEGRLPEQVSIVRELTNVIKTYISIIDIRLHAGESKTFYPQETVLAVCDKLCEIRMDIISGTISNEDLTKVIQNLYGTLVSPGVLSAVPQPMIASVVETHSHLFYILLDSGFDVNFWNGIELA